MSQPDEEYAGYSTTTKVREHAGVEQQDDIKPRFVTDAIKGIEAFIEGETGLSWSPKTDAPENIKLITTLISSAVVRMKLADENRPYQDDLNLGMLLLSKLTGINSDSLISKLGFMYVSTGNTSPMNLDADPFISIRQPW